MSVINRNMNIFSLEAVLPVPLSRVQEAAEVEVAVLLSAVAEVALARIADEGDGDDDGRNNHDADRQLRFLFIFILMSIHLIKFFGFFLFNFVVKCIVSTGKKLTVTVKLIS